jgi:hypothetical protein
MRTHSAPASAPESADSQGARVVLSRESVLFVRNWEEDAGARDRRERRKDAKNSLEANHAAVPPVSRKIVPVWPSQRPPGPEARRIFLIIVNGPGRIFRTEANGAKFCCRTGLDIRDAGLDDDERGEEGNFLGVDGISNGVVSIWTCILHLTSSIGVLRNCDQLAY